MTFKRRKFAAAVTLIEVKVAMAEMVIATFDYPAVCQLYDWRAKGF